MFNTLTWVAFSISTFFGFYDNKDDYIKKEKPNYQAKIERDYQSKNNNI